MGTTTGKGIVVTWEGALYGLMIATKMTIALSSGLFLILTTRPIELMKPLMKIGLPSSIALMVISALKFIPTMYEEISSTLKALKLKGVALSLRNFFSVGKIVIRNAIHKSIRRAMILGLSLDLRGVKGKVKIPSGQNYEARVSFLLMSLTFGQTLLIFSLHSFW